MSWRQNSNDGRTALKQRRGTECKREPGTSPRIFPARLVPAKSIKFGKSILYG